jgi:hypothetical protein
MQHFIDNDKYSIYLASAGAGYKVLKLLTELPGSSRFFVGASFPYHTSDTDKLIGFTPEKYVSAEVAHNLAFVAYMKARSATPSENTPRKCIGIGITSTIASSKVHRGGAKAFITIITDDGYLHYKLPLQDRIGQEGRAEDEKDIADSISAALNVHAVKDQAILSKWYTADSSLLIQELMKRPTFYATGERREFRQEDFNTIYPGAFNPFHDAHKEIATYVDLTDAIALDIDPPHKPHLSITDVLSRVAWIHQKVDLPVVVIQNAPLFLDKMNKFNANLVVGYDAYQRMIDPAWGVSLVNFTQYLIHVFCNETDAREIPPQLENNVFFYSISRTIRATDIRNKWNNGKT